MHAWSVVRDLQHETHSSSAVNRVLHDQAHALTCDTLMWTAMTAYW